MFVLCRSLKFSFVSRADLMPAVRRAAGYGRGATHCWGEPSGGTELGGGVPAAASRPVWCSKGGALFMKGVRLALLRGSSAVWLVRNVGSSRAGRLQQGSSKAGTPTRRAPLRPSPQTTSCCTAARVAQEPRVGRGSFQRSAVLRVLRPWISPSASIPRGGCFVSFFWGGHPPLACHVSFSAPRHGPSHLDAPAAGGHGPAASGNGEGFLTGAVYLTRRPGAGWGPLPTGQVRFLLAAPKA